LLRPGLFRAGRRGLDILRRGLRRGRFWRCGDQRGDDQSQDRQGGHNSRTASVHVLLEEKVAASAVATVE